MRHGQARAQAKGADHDERGAEVVAFHPVPIRRPDEGDRGPYRDAPGVLEGARPAREDDDGWKDDQGDQVEEHPERAVEAAVAWLRRRLPRGDAEGRAD